MEARRYWVPTCLMPTALGVVPTTAAIPSAATVGSGATTPIGRQDYNCWATVTMMRPPDGLLIGIPSGTLVVLTCIPIRAIVHSMELIQPGIVRQEKPRKNAIRTSKAAMISLTAREMIQGCIRGSHQAAALLALRPAMTRLRVIYIP